MGDNIIKLELTQNEVNDILLILAKKPYEEVFELIHKIREQSMSQLAQLWTFATTLYKRDLVLSCIFNKNFIWDY